MAMTEWQDVGMSGTEKEQLQAIYDVVVGSIYSYENPKYYFESIKTGMAYNGAVGHQPGTTLELNTENLSTLYVGSLTHPGTDRRSECNIVGENGTVLHDFGMNGAGATDFTLDISGNNKITINLHCQLSSNLNPSVMTNVRVY